MLNLLAAAAVRVAGGSITDQNSALFNPNFKYTHHQIVVGVAFDAVVCSLLMGALFYAAYRYWGPPARRKIAAAGGVDDATTLLEEGKLLGLQPWVWSLISCAALAAAVLSSVVYYG